MEAKKIYVLWCGSDDGEHAGRAKEEIVGAFDSEDKMIQYVHDRVLEAFTSGAECYVRMPASYEFTPGSQINIEHDLYHQIERYCRYEVCEMK